MTIAAQPDSAPDWSKVTETIRCPLCEYELRGLTAPRCPECGFQFAWPEVLHADRRPHPYLFEHHPKRNMWSFVRTKLAGFAPWRFWQTLKPTMPIVPRRLALYWFIHLPLLLALVLAGFVRFWLNVAPAIAQFRTSTFIYLQRNPNEQVTQDWIKRYGSLVKAIDTETPDPYNFAGIKHIAQQYCNPAQGVARPDYNTAAALLILWPWLTFATLMIFRISMARAKVKPIHVLRCIIYSCDMVLIAIALLVPIAPAFTSFSYDPIRAFGCIVLSCVILSALTLVKLGFAYRLYLQFPHAWTTAIVSQFVVSLAIVSIASAVLFWR